MVSARWADLATKRFYEELGDSFGVSWLTLSEIRASVEHMKIQNDWIADQIALVLNAMQAIESQYGKDRARLLFGFD